MIPVAERQDVASDQHPADREMRRIGTYRSFDPGLRHKLTTTPYALQPIEFTQLGEVARRQVQAAECHLDALAVGQPIAFALHTKRLVELFLHVTGNRSPRRANEHDPKRLGIG